MPSMGTIFKTLVAACLLFTVTPAFGESSKLSSGGLYTELGMGVRFTNISSYLENPNCVKAVVVDPLWPENPRGNGTYSCGGNEPIFVGDVIGWEFKNGASVALCHKSQWFDGHGELHWTGICGSYRIYWKRFKR